VSTNQEVISVLFILKGKGLEWNVLREGCKCKVITTENAMVVVYNMQPGPEIQVPPHKHEDVEQIAHIIKSKANFIVNGKSVTAEAGDFLVFKPGTIHGGKIIGDKMTVTIDIFIPPLEGLSIRGNKSLRLTGLDSKKTSSKFFPHFFL